MTTKFLLVIGLYLSAITYSSKSEAHPVAFAGSYSIMTWNSKEMSDWMFTHSFTSRYSLSARSLRLKTQDGEREFYLPQLNFLLKRWNELDSQANIYLSLGHGGEKVNKSLKDTSVLGLDVDWESRKYYVSFKEEVVLSHRNNDLNIYQTKFRAGFAPYLAEFNELNSWFILQLDHSNKVEESIKITPLIRLFYQNILLEFGASQKGDSQFNFMVHF